MKKKLLCFLASACAAICVGYASQKASAANVTLTQLPAMDIENRRWSIESFFDGNVLIIVADKLRSDRLYTFDRYRPVFPEISLIDGMVRGTTGCAGFVGKYSLAGDQLSLDPSALMTPGCREIQWEISHGISAALRGDLTIRQDGERRLFVDGAGRVQIVLAPWQAQTQ